MGEIYISDKKRSLTLVFCILGFFGLGGIHRFYVGKVWTGLLYLATCGLFGIGTILDLISISMRRFKDSLGDVVSED